MKWKLLSTKQQSLWKKMHKFFYSVFFIGLLFSSPAAFCQQLSKVSIGLDFKIPDVIAQKEQIKHLQEIKKNQNIKNYKGCIEESDKLASKVSFEVIGWVRKVQLECLNALFAENPKVVAQYYSKLTSLEMMQEPRMDLLNRMLRTLFIEFHLNMADYYKNLKPSKSLRSLNFIEGIVNRADGSLFGRWHLYYAWHLIRLGKVEKASRFFALAESYLKEDSFLPTLNEIRGKLPEKKEDIKNQNGIDETDVPHFVDKAEGAYEKLKQISDGEFLKKIQAGIHFLNQFPGARKFETVELQLWRDLNQMLGETTTNVKSLRIKIKKAPIGVITNWANRSFWRGLYQQSLRFAEAALDKKANSLDGKEYEIAGRSAHALGSYSLAHKYYSMFLQKYQKSPIYSDILVQFGLVLIRQQEYVKADAVFAHLFTEELDGEYRSLALYWRAYASNFFDKKRSKSLTENLADMYPLTYYGLRAQIVDNKFNLEFPIKNPILMVDFNWTPNKTKQWIRYLILAAGDWRDEAKNELQDLFIPTSAEEKLILAHLYSIVGGHHEAISLVDEALSENKNLMNKNVIKLRQPKEFEELVSQYSNQNKIPLSVALGLIKQESSFRTDAVSSSNAVGLMQLVSATAKEVASDLKIKAIDFPQSLFEKELNIRFGTYYLRKLMRANTGNLPVALACYNAGIGRIWRWLRARDMLNELKSVHSSQALNEIWIDELPWSETRYYVKSILRNELLYRWLAQGSIELNDPIWEPK